MAGDLSHYPELQKRFEGSQRRSHADATIKLLKEAPVSGLLTRLGKWGTIAAVTIESARFLNKVRVLPEWSDFDVNQSMEEKLAAYAQSKGVTGVSLANLLATCMVESSFRPTRESHMYRDPARARRTFGALRRMSDAAVSQLVAAGPQTFFEAVYGPQTEKGRELGNVRRGDGYAFRGGGLIQLTGRSMFAAFSEWDGVDYVSKHELISQPDPAVHSAVWYWKTFVEGRGKHLDIRAATSIVNPGTPTLGKRVQMAAAYGNAMRQA